MASSASTFDRAAGAQLQRHLAEQRGPVGDAANAALRGELADGTAAAVEEAVRALETALKRRRLGR